MNGNVLGAIFYVVTCSTYGLVTGSAADVCVALVTGIIWAGLAWTGKSER